MLFPLGSEDGLVFPFVWSFQACRDQIKERRRTSTPAAPWKRDAEANLALGRLSVLDLAQESGNVAEAYWQRGLGRTKFHARKRQFQTQRFAGLKVLPPIPKSHPQHTAAPVVERIKALARTHPACGCNR